MDVYLSQSASEYLNLRSFHDLRLYFNKHEGKETENDFASVDFYIRHCDLEDLVRFINHPSPRLKQIIEERLSGKS